MKKIIHILVVGLISVILGSCTSARWTVKEKSAVDKSEYEILARDNFLQQSGELSPESPVLTLDLLTQTKYEYTQRVLVQRNIQDYRLRPGFVALGLGGAAMAFYVANASGFTGNVTSTKSLALNAAGGILALSGFLNMKPVGEPRPTGEERYLRSTGTTVQVDTVRAGSDIKTTAFVNVQYKNQVIFEEKNRSISNGALQIGLANILNELQLSGPQPDSVSIDVTFEDSTYHYRYPVEQILQPYARVTSKLTELRNSPEETPDNILADLAKGSQLQITNSEDEDWYQVLYGISKNYIRKEDAELIWRSADFIQDDQVVTVPRVPFGDIDVESNIPILRGPTPNAIALILTNENYSGDLPERNYAHRDGQLIYAYLTNALGYSKQNVYQLHDISEPDQLYRTLSDMRLASNDSTEVFVYLSGYGMATSGSDVQLQLLGVSDNGDRKTIGLQKLFEQISTLTTEKTVVLSDIDFSATIPQDRFTTNEGQEIIETNAAPLVEKDRNASLLMGTQLSHPTSLYTSPGDVDKKHHIFPYFFAKALQQRRTSMASIYQYLERNVSYTARKLYDRPQDPLLIGNSTLDLISQ